jgi:TolA-binding protein
MKAQERHKLKQNDFLETALSVAGVVRDNRGPFALILGIVIVVAAIGSGYWYWQNRRANEAGALLGIAMATEQAPITPAPSLPGATQTPGTYPTEDARSDAAIKAFTEVATQYPGTDAALSANYQLGSELLSRGRTADAAAAFEKVSSSGSTFYAPLGRLGGAQVLMAEGKTDEALKIYTELAASRDTSLPVDGLLMEMARAAQKAGKTQEARAAYKRVTDEFPDSQYVADARQQLAALN